MIKKVLILSAVLALTACGSKETAPQPTDAEIDNAGPVAATPAAQQTNKEAPKEIKATPNEKTNLQVAQQGLTEAIKSQNEEAIYRAATNVLALSPKDLKAQNALGVYHYKKGHFLAAQYFFNRALQTSPNSSELHNNLGLISLALKEKRDAIKSFRKAIELDSGNATAAANVSSIYIEEKDYNKALVGLEIAARKNNKDYRILNNYGVALAGVGKYSQAKDQYQAALSLNSSGREAMLNLAIVEIDQLKNYQDGLDVLNKLRFLGPPEATRTRINALENKAKAGLK